MILITVNKAKKTSKGTYYKLRFVNTPRGNFYVSIGYMTKREADKYKEVCEAIAQDNIFGRLSTKTKAYADSFFAKDPVFRSRLVAKGFIQEDESKKTMFELIQVDLKRRVEDNHYPRSIVNSLSNQTHFLGFENMRDASIQDVSVEDIKRFITYLESPQEVPVFNDNGELEVCDDGVVKLKSRIAFSPSTIAGILKDITTAFNLAIKKGWLDQHPVQYDKKKYRSQKSRGTVEKQNELLRLEFVDEVMAIQSEDYDFVVLKHLLRWLGCRIGEAQILRWSDVDFENNRICFRGKDSKREAEGDYEALPYRTVPLWPQLRPVLWEAYNRELGRALEKGTEMRKHVINDTLDLAGEREFPLYKMTDWKPEKIANGRYGKTGSAGKKLTRELEANGLEVYPQPCHGLRDYRANELYRLGYNINEIDAWTGNTEAVRKKHYSATAVNADDIANALARETSRLESQEGQKPEGNTSGDGHTTGNNNANQASGNMVVAKLTDTTPFKPELPTEIAGMLSNASESDVLALVEYAHSVYENRRRVGEKRSNNRLVVK